MSEQTMQDEMRELADDLYSVYGTSDIATILSTAADRIDELEKLLQGNVNESN